MVFTVGGSLLSIALVSGLVYEQVQRAKDREQFPQIGRSVDIGGRTLNLYCSGTGSPAVILQSGATWPFFDSPKAMFENGVPRPGYSWTWIQRELANVTTACWYDRAGSGWSDLGPYPRDSASQARELHALLQSAGVAPPYVLVAESSAALDARVYAAAHPGEVAGLVLVDGVHPDLLIAGWRSKRPRFPAQVRHSQDLAVQAANRLGLYRLGPVRPAPDPPPPHLTADEWRTIWHLTQSSKARSALIQDITVFRQSATQARAAGNLGDRPLRVINSGRLGGMDLQSDFVQLSTRGKQIVVINGEGDLIYREPEAIVQAAHEVVAAARQK